MSADGQSVVWASRLLGDPLPERVAGIDLMAGLLERAERRGYSVYFLGARAEVLERAVERLREKYPRLHVAGARDGYFADDEASEVCDEIRASRADLLFVAMSSPRKEYFLGEYGPNLGAPFVMGVGGSIDVIAGVTRRAPEGLAAPGSRVAVPPAPGAAADVPALRDHELAFHRTCRPRDVVGSGWRDAASTRELT